MTEKDPVNHESKNLLIADRDKNSSEIFSIDCRHGQYEIFLASTVSTVEKVNFHVSLIGLDGSFWNLNLKKMTRQLFNQRFAPSFSYLRRLLTFVCQLLAMKRVLSQLGMQCLYPSVSLVNSVLSHVVCLIPYFYMKIKIIWLGKCFVLTIIHCFILSLSSTVVVSLIL